jgi:DNA polymerase-3 subunit gamma/tau
VKFLLATTDPQKLPVTVLSRCLQFNLKRLPAALIARYLDEVLERESIPREEEAVRLLARAGDGSMRDALSLLDQAIAFGGGRVERAAVAAMLGSIDRRWVVDLLEALAAHDAPALLSRVAELDESAPDYAAVLAELLSLLQRVALAQVAPEALPDDDWTDSGDARRLAGVLAPEDVQLFYQIALLGRRDLPLMPEPRGGFEMVLLRMLCFRPTTLEMPAPAPERDPAPAPVPAPAANPAVRTPPAPPLVAPVSDSSASEWGNLVQELGLTGIARQVALHCALVERKDQHFRLMLEPGHAQMFSKNIEERLKIALEQHLGSPVDLRVQIGDAAALATPARQQAERRAERQQAAADHIAQDPHIRDLQQRFDARIAAIHPLEETDE